MTGIQEGGVAVKVLYSRNVHVVEPLSAIEYQDEQSGEQDRV